MELQNYLDLIHEAGCVYEKHHKIRKQSGADFNIFEVINITRDENRFSSIIASLLNPNGSHMQGDRYLRLFLEILFDKKPSIFGNDFHINDIITKAHVETEQFNTVQNEGGRIDIVIETHDYAIVIENKIDAGDQENQLWRYQQSKKNKHGTIIVYLTLDGRNPDQKSTTLKSLEDESDLELNQIVCMSYQDDILNWLEQCLIDTPENISTIIRHFSQTIKRITNQEDNDMDKELALLLENADKLKLADEITKAAKLARAQIEYKFFMALKNELDLELRRYGFFHNPIPFSNEKIIWNWNDKNQELLLDQIIKTNSQNAGAVRLAYKNQHDDILFIADGYGLESFWYGFESKNTIPKEIENYLSKNDNSVRWAYYPHIKLPLWGDGIYTLASNMDEIIAYVVSDICNNILAHIPRVKQTESTAVSSKPQYRSEKKLDNHIEE